MALSENGIIRILKGILEKIKPGSYSCRKCTRSKSAGSAIGKPVDLEIFQKSNSKCVLIAVEVADVNVTQLVGEVCRTFFDSCPLKILVLGNRPRNTSKKSKDDCERLFCRLYGQDEIENTMARVVWHDEHDQIEIAIRQLLLR